MSPHENGAFAATLVFAVVCVVTGIANLLVGRSFVRDLGVIFVLTPMGLVYFGHTITPHWLAVSTVAGLLLVIWSQRRAAVARSRAEDSRGSDAP